jgi:hypothetical protein
MKMKYRLIVILLSISGLVSAQKVYDNSTLLVKANLTSLMDFTTFPAIQASIEKKFSRKFSISSELGYQVYDFRITDTVFYKPRGFKANVEFRFWAPRFLRPYFPVNLGNIYLGIRPFFSQNQYSASVSFRKDMNTGKWYDDSFGVKKINYGINYIFGLQKSVSRELVMDVYTGVGIMNKVVENSELQYDKDSGDILGGTFLNKLFFNRNLSDISGIKVNVLLGFRLGYKLK